MDQIAHLAPEAVAGFHARQQPSLVHAAVGRPDAIVAEPGTRVVDGAGRLALPGLEAWGEGKELLFGALVMGVVFASFLVGLYLAHRGNLPQGAI